jgi:hypothetical protein
VHRLIYISTCRCIDGSEILIGKSFQKLYYFDSFILCEIRIITSHSIPKGGTVTVRIINNLFIEVGITEIKNPPLRLNKIYMYCKTLPMARL